MASAPDPRPQARIVNPDAGKGKVAREQVCRVCRRGPVTRHHLIGKGQRGDDVELNIIPLCGTGTTGCHGIVTDGHPSTCADGLRRTPDEVRVGIRRNLSPEELSYVIAKKSLAWLDQHYPYA